MDNTDPNKSALRMPFITAANALANLYKSAASAEKEARDVGSRAAYMHIMQWAARKSRKNEGLTPAELINLCTTELSKIPASSSTPTPAATRSDDDASPPFSSSATRALPHETRLRSAQQQTHSQQSQGSSGGAMRDDVLASGIRKLAVNPRKRQRTAISETFIRACEDGYGNLFSMGSAPHGSDRDRPFMSPLDDTDSRDGRPPAAPGSRNSAEISVRKTRSGRGNFIEKQRRK